MSGEIGEIIRDGESSKSSNVDGANLAENGSSGAAGNLSQPTNIIDGYESWNPSGPATERIARAESPADGNGEPKRTKTGRIDRRTRAGRGTQTQSTDSVTSVPRNTKLISLESAILSLHDMAAGIFGIEEICITEKEASALNDAVLEVSKYYVSAFDPKKVAIFNLATCMGGIYATRIMAYRNRMTLERRTKLSVMPNKVEQPAPQPTREGITIEQYLGGMPPAEGAAGF